MTIDEIKSAAQAIEQDLPRPIPVTKLLATVAIGFMIAFVPGCYLLHIPVWVAFAISGYACVGASAIIATEVAKNRAHVRMVARELYGIDVPHGTSVRTIQRLIVARWRS